MPAPVAVSNGDGSLYHAGHQERGDGHGTRPNRNHATRHHGQLHSGALQRPEARHSVKEEAYEATTEGLAVFINAHLLPTCIRMEKEARYHHAIKAQTLGEGLEIYRLERLNRYETHLDRKFERTLAMLLKMKELRSACNLTS